jgi:SlyX protein
MEERMIRLESTFAYQDDRIRKLENVVSQQQLELHELRQALELLSKQLQSAAGPAMPNPANEPPPPHY